MHITSLNLAGYKDWQHRRQNIKAYFDTAQSDVVFFQEVKFDTNVSNKSQANLINSSLEQPYEYAQTTVSRIYISSAGEEAREGLAVLSRYPIIESEVLVLKKQDDDKHTRIVQNVDILIGGKIQKFANVHFSNNDYSDEQLEETLSVIRSRHEERIIVGDFNIADITSVAPLFEHEYNDSFSYQNYISFPSEQATFDYVLLPKSYTFQSLSTGESLSDHTALTFEV